MEHYVGLDVSLRQTAVCVVDQSGKIVRESVTPSDPEAIAGFIKSNALHLVRVGLESGPTSTWLWTELDRMGLPVICIDARHAKAALILYSAGFSDAGPRPARGIPSRCPRNLHNRLHHAGPAGAVICLTKAPALRPGICGFAGDTGKSTCWQFGVRFLPVAKSC
jgi:hypothetical protein